MYQTEVVNGQTVPDQSTICFYKATLSGTTLSDITLVWSATGSDQTYPAGATVDLSVSAGYTDALASNILTHADQDGTLKAGAVDNVAVIADDIITPAKFTDELKGGWAVGEIAAPTAVTANGNRSYTLTYASSIASTISPGMRRRFTRTVAGPTTAFSLDGSNDYYVKTSPSGMTFTDDFVVSAWVYLTAYPSGAGTIASRYNGTSGWSMDVNSSGQVRVYGFNAGAANTSSVQSYQSIPLNRWVHIAGQLDMSTFTATTTTSYVMLDGKDVPALVARTGTNPSALVQAGNFEIGTSNTANPFPGYIDQVAIYNAKVLQATILASMHQALTGSETSLISAYSNGSVTDLSANANNLTATNGATTVSSSWHGNRGVSSTLEYALTMSVSSDGLTEVVQVPEGCALPTTGGITASAYSSMANPYGWVSDKGRWQVASITRAFTLFTPVSGTAYNYSSVQLSIPVGSWVIEHRETMRIGVSSAGGTYANGGTWLATTAASGTGLLEDSYNVVNHDFGTGPDVLTLSLYCNPIPLTVAASTVYYLNWSLASGGTIYANQCGYSGSTPTTVRVTPSGL